MRCERLTSSIDVYWVVRKKGYNRYFGYRGPTVMGDFGDARRLSTEAEAIDLAKQWDGIPVRVTMTTEDIDMEMDN